MKIMRLVLSTIIALSFTRGYASEQSSGPLTAKQILTQQYAELEDLKAQVKKARTMRTAGTVGIVISTAAVGAGAFLGVVGTFGGALVNAAAISMGQQPKSLASGMVLEKILFFGGAAGLVGSSVVVVLESKDLDKLEHQIEKLEEQIKSTYGLLN